MNKDIQNYTRRTFLSAFSKITLAGTFAISGCSWRSDYNKVETIPGIENINFLPAWKEGYLDIHHIATGKGESTFLICPDGTTILIDAGDVVNSGSVIPAIPNDVKSPGERIIDYINHFSPSANTQKFLDYLWISHFHGDHIGHRESNSIIEHGYALSGVTRVGESIDIKKIIDRGWPNYDFPSRNAIMSASGNFLDDYLKFVEYQRANKQTLIEGFIAGSNSQFVLQNKPTEYPNFKVQNIFVNGQIWTGQGTNTRTLFTVATSPDENMLSGAIKLTYGRFNYFTGGDISGASHAQYASLERDIETPIGQITGLINVLKANHHAWIDAMNTNFLKSLTPQSIVIPIWHIDQPHSSTLARMIDKLVYPGDRDIFVTGFSEGNKKKLGAAANAFKSSGHVVCRVYENGLKYKMFVLDPQASAYPIIYESNDILV